MHTARLHRFLLIATCLLAMSGTGLAHGVEQPQPRLLPIDDNLYMVDVNLHTEEEIMDLLTKLETISQGPRSKQSKPRIVLMLHGREVEFFAIRNYPKYKHIVDLAARLDAFKAVEVKMCQRAMRLNKVKEDEVPAFIDLVPYGPDELKRLKGQGYNYLM